MSHSLQRTLRATAACALALGLMTGAAQAQPYGKGGNFIQAPNKPARPSAPVRKDDAVRAEPAKAADADAASTSVNDTAPTKGDAPAPAER